MNPTTHPTPAATSRRRFIHLLGGGMVLAAGGVSTGCSSALPAAALQPWQNPAAESDPRRYVLAHALRPKRRAAWAPRSPVSAAMCASWRARWARPCSCACPAA